MSKKRYVNTVFWDDAYITNLDPSEKLIFIYLLTRKKVVIFDNLFVMARPAEIESTTF